MPATRHIQILNGWPQSDMAETDETKPSYVKNKPDFITEEDVSNKVSEEVSRLIGTALKTFTKTFVLSDWAKLTEEPLYMVQIKKSEHKLENPVLFNALLTYTWVDEDGITQSNVGSSIDISDRVLSTGTVKLYVNCDLTKYEKYDLKIILQGD